MSKLTRDGTAEPVSRDQFFRREGDRDILIFPVRLTARRIGNLTRLIHTLAICDDHTYVHINYTIRPSCCLKKKLNASKPSEHPTQGGKCQNA